MTSETFERELLLGNYFTFRRAMRIFFEREKLHQEEIKNDLGRCEIISIQKALNKMMIIKDTGVHQNVFHTSSAEYVAGLVTKMKLL